MKSKSKFIQLLPVLFSASTFLSVVAPAQAQTNPDALWLKAGVGLTGSSGAYTAWQSQVASPNNFTFTASASNNFSSSTMGTGNAPALKFGDNGTANGIFATSLANGGKLTNVFGGVDTTTGGTLLIAFSPANTTESAAQRLLDTTNYISTGWDLVWQNDVVGFRQTATTGEKTWNTPAIFTAGGNYVFTMTYDNSSLSYAPTIYLNNSTTALTLTTYTPTASFSGAATSDVNKQLRIGGRASNPNGEGFEGKIGEIRIYDSILTGTDLTSSQNYLYNTYVAVVPEPSTVVGGALLLGVIAFSSVNRARKAQLVEN